MSSMTLSMLLMLKDMASGPLGQFMGKLQKMSHHMMTGGAAAQSMGQKMLDAMQFPLNSFMEAEDAMIRLKTTMMGKEGGTPKLLKEMEEQATQLGNKLPGTAAQLQQMYATLVKEGVPAQEVLNGIGEATGNLAVVMGIGFTDTAKFISKAANAFKIPAQDMTGFADTIQKIGHLGLDASQMGYAFSNMSGAFTKYGIAGKKAADGMAPLVALLIKSTGLSAETVGTNFATALDGLYDFEAGNKGKKIAAQMRALGVELDIFGKDRKYLGDENLMKQMDKLKKLPIDVQDAFKKAAFGGGADADIAEALIGQGTKGHQEFLKRMQDQATLKMRVNEMLLSLTNIWESAKGAFETTLGKWIKTLAPELKAAADLFGKLSDKIGQLIEQHPQMAKFTAAAALIGGGTLLTGGAALSGIGMAMNMASTAGTVFTNMGKHAGDAGKKMGDAAKGVKTWNTNTGNALKNSLLTADLGAGFKNLAGRVRTSLKQVGNSMKAIPTNVGNTLRNMGTALSAIPTNAGNALGNVSGALRAMPKTISGALKAMPGQLRALKAAAGSQLSNGLKAVAGGIRAIGLATIANPVGLIIAGIALGALLIYKYWKPITGFFRGLWAGLKVGLKGLKPAFDAAFKALAPILNPVIGALKGVWNWVKNLLNPVNDTGGAAEKMGKKFGLALAEMISKGQEMLSHFMALPEKFASIGSGIVTGLWNGLKSKWEGMSSWLSGAASGLTGMVKNIFGINSPSRVFMKIGSGLGLGLQLGMAAKMGQVHNVAQQMAKAATPAFSMNPIPSVGNSQFSSPSVVASPGLSNRGQAYSGKSVIVNHYFNPTIHVSGATNTGVREQVQAGIQNSYTDFRRMMERYERDQRRVSA